MKTVFLFSTLKSTWHAATLLHAFPPHDLFFILTLWNHRLPTRRDQGFIHPGLSRLHFSLLKFWQSAAQVSSKVNKLTMPEKTTLPHGALAHNSALCSGICNCLILSGMLCQMSEAKKGQDILCGRVFHLTDSLRYSFNFRSVFLGWRASRWAAQNWGKPLLCIVFMLHFSKGLYWCWIMIISVFWCSDTKQFVLLRCFYPFQIGDCGSPSNTLEKHTVANCYSTFN